MPREFIQRADLMAGKAVSCAPADHDLGTALRVAGLSGQGRCYFTVFIRHHIVWGNNIGLKAGCGEHEPCRQHDLALHFDSLPLAESVGRGIP